MEVPSHQVFLTTLRTDMDVDRTKAETSRNRRDAMDFPLTQDQWTVT